MAENVERLDPLVIAGEYETAAERIMLPHAEEATVAARPDAVSRLWVEDEYDELEAEQAPLWDATGTEHARPHLVTAARLRLGSAEVEQIVTEHRGVVDDARQRLLDTLQALAPYRRRAKGVKVWYQAAKAGFLLGDIAGFGTATIWLGELPVIAVTLATSAAVATVAAGLIGTEVSDHRARLLRHRPADELTEKERLFPHLFTAEDRGYPVMKSVLLVSALTAALIGMGIATLRAVVDDPLVGLVFGGIALAVAGGSFLVSYAGADEAADHIDHAHADYAAAITRQLRLAGLPEWQQHAAAEAEADSILTEHTHRGQAARDHVRALKWGILRRNPSHAGHGPTNTVPATAVGRTTRKDTHR